MQEAWDRGLAIGGLPPSENIDIPNKPTDIDTNPAARKAWKKETVRFSNYLEST